MVVKANSGREGLGLSLSVLPLSGLAARVSPNSAVGSSTVIVATDLTHVY